METIKEALTFDDVLLTPKYSNILPSKTNIDLNLTKKIILKVPFLTSAMDTVTESKMAIAIGKEGGLGIIHRNLSIKKQSIEVKKVKNKKLFVGAAIGTGPEDLERARSLLSNGVDLIVIDTAHGHSEKVLKILTKVKRIAHVAPGLSNMVIVTEDHQMIAWGANDYGQFGKLISDSGIELESSIFP